jgi:hypothetical protein
MVPSDDLRPTVPKPALRRALKLALALVATLALASAAAAHGIGGKDADFVAAADGPEIFPFMYLGGKHMVTGYDHILFILGIVFFLYRLSRVALYVTLFSLGHSLTLLAGVLFNVPANSYLVDAIIGLSVVYKAFDNLDGFKTLFGFRPDNRIAVAAFGLAHGFGLAAKLQVLMPSPNGLVINLVAFNVGVELGQLLVLTAMLVLILSWRRTESFKRYAVAANVIILAAGILLTELQLYGYFATTGA